MNKLLHMQNFEIPLQCAKKPSRRRRLIPHFSLFQFTRGAILQSGPYSALFTTVWLTSTIDKVTRVSECSYWTSICHCFCGKWRIHRCRWAGELPSWCRKSSRRLIKSTCPKSCRIPATTNLMRQGLKHRRRPSEPRTSVFSKPL